MINTAFTIVFGLLCACSLWLWWIVVRRLLAGKPIVTKQVRNPSTLGLIDVVIMFATWFFGQLLAFAVFFGMFGIQAGSLEGLDADQQAMMIGLVSLGQLIGTLVGLTMVILRNRKWDGLSVSTANFFEGVRLGVLGFGLVVPPILVLQLGLSRLVPYQHATFEMLNQNSPLISFVLAWSAAVIVAPICEEVYFRGVLQNWLQRVFSKDQPSLDSLIAGGRNRIEGEFSDGAVDPMESSSSFPFAAVIVASLIFGLVHFGQGLAPVPLFFFGLALGYLYHQTGNLISCIVLHVALNAFSMFWFTVQMLGSG